MVRVNGFVNHVANNLNREWLSWSNTEGLKRWQNNGFVIEDAYCTDPLDILGYFKDSEEDIILILEDFHL